MFTSPKENRMEKGKRTIDPQEQTMYGADWRSGAMHISESIVDWNVW